MCPGSTGHASVASQPAHSATPSFGSPCPPGFYKAVVVATSTLYSERSSTSEADQAPLGYPGQIVIQSVAM